MLATRVVVVAASSGGWWVALAQKSRHARSRESEILYTGLTSSYYVKLYINIRTDKNVRVGVTYVKEGRGD